MDTKHIQIKDFNYNLPDERIAKFPLAKRDNSKLLLYRHGEVTEDVFHNIAQYLPKGALMVFNNTKVIQARLHFRKETGALIEVFLLEPYMPADYEQMFQTTGHCSWLCMIGNLKKWKEGTLKRTFDVKGKEVTLVAERKEDVHKSYRVDFSWDASDVSWAELLDAVGELPIPPYLNRETQESDKTTYQTVYSKIKGSVAAPTAGLHFTPELMDTIRAKGVNIAEVTLHVGLGTFRPVQEDEIADHKMHSEWYCIDEKTAQMIRDTKAAGHRVIAVGTTSCRTLEAVAAKYGEIRACSGNTSIFLYPGVKFNCIDGLITNFHLPESTLIMLVSALYGYEKTMAAYKVAVEERYRFFSFGDAMLIL